MPEYSRDIYAAMDLLNSWVRSESARGWWSSPRNAIYDWKNHLIESAIKNSIAVNSAIYLTLYCRDCGGCGKYTDSDGHTWPHCRKCANTGKQRLSFLVTEIHGFTWHTPRDRTWRFGLPEDFWSQESLSVDWEPNATGCNLELLDLVRLLNLLEPTLPKPGSHIVCYRGEEFGESHHGRYKLRLGSFHDVCQLCGTPQPPGEPFKHGVSHGVIREHFEWSAWACDECVNCFRETGIFERFPVPTITGHPFIQEWLSRRHAAKEVIHA